MAEQFAPIAKDSSLNTTDLTPKNIADVLQDGLATLANSVKPTADEIPFDNTGTSLVSTDVEGAIKETLPIRGSLSNDSMTFAIPQNVVALVLTSHPYDSNACGAWIVCGGYTTGGATVTPIKTATSITVTKTANQVVQVSTTANAFVTVVGLN